MNLRTAVTSFLLAMVMLQSIAVIYLHQTRFRVAFVNSFELVEGYKGTIEARAKFEKSRAIRMSNVDSLKVAFEQARTVYLEKAASMTPAARQERELVLTEQQRQVIMYTQAVEAKIKEEGDRMMQEVLDQINTFVKTYAAQEKYDLLLGTTASGSLLYGKENLDVTVNVLNALNNHYSGK